MNLKRKPINGSSRDILFDQMLVFPLNSVVLHVPMKVREADMMFSDSSGESNKAMEGVQLNGMHRQQYMQVVH